MGAEKRQSLSVVTNGTNCSVWFQPDRWSSWGTQLIFNLIGWRGKLWAKWGHITIEAIQTCKAKWLKTGDHKSSMGDWKGQYTGLRSQHSIKNVPFYPVSHIYCSLCSSRVHIHYSYGKWGCIPHQYRAFSGCHIQSGNLYYLQISVTLVIPL